MIGRIARLDAPRSGPVAWAVLLLLLLALPALAQEEEYIPEESEEPGPVIEAEGGEADFSVIDDLLALDEEVQSDPGIYSYDPGARRDPFRSLVERNKVQTEEEQKRPEGPQGLLIDEIIVEGVFVLPEGPIVQIQSLGQDTSYLLRPGDQLWDGDVVSISFEEVIFKQSVNDPTALKPFREVVKRLEP